MKLLRIVRSEASREVIKFIELSKDCTVKEFASVIQLLFGNPATVGSTQVLCDSSGKKVAFEFLESGKTYFVTFDKKDTKSLLSWDSSYSDIVPFTSSSRIRVLDQSEFFTSKINENRALVKDKTMEFMIKQEDSLLTLKQSLNKIHTILGSQSLTLMEYQSATGAVLSKVRFLIPTLQQSIKELKSTNEELKTAYTYKLPAELANRGRKKFMDPRILNYMKNFSYKDIPRNELTPAEMRRFMKFQMISENSIAASSSQNTPSGNKGINLKTKMEERAKTKAV